MADHMLTKEPNKSDFADVLHLVELMVVLPISSSDCERAFSAQKQLISGEAIRPDTHQCRRT